jgi:lysophospholipase L1-like esterase
MPVQPPLAIGHSILISGEPHRAASRRPHDRPSRRFKTLFRLVALGMALGTACGVAELGLRVCGYGRNYTNPMGSFFEPDSELGCHGKANFVGRFRRTDFDVVVEHDANGFRRNELPLDPAAQHAVYVLGDSFVWGYGVAQHDLLTNQMARRLPNWQVHNLGLIGAGTVQEYLIFQKHVADRLRPGDTVLLVFFGNDFGDNIGLNLSGRVYAAIDNGQVRLVPPTQASTVRQWKNWLKDSSYLFNLLSFCTDRFQDSRSMKNLGDRTTRLLPPPEKIEADTSDSGPAVQITRHYMRELKNACQAKQARFMVAYVPGQTELGEDDVTSTSDLSLPEEVASRQAFERMVHDLAIDTVDLMTPMVAARRTGRFDRLTFAHDFHWNASGHTVAAEAISGALQ